MSGKFLLVTSDDFGMCHAINLGILRSMVHGVVRSTNFLVPCPWFSEAFSLAKAHTLPVGVHLCLTCDWDHLKWGPLTSAPSLRDEHGHFLPRYEKLQHQARDRDIVAELEAQILRVKSLGFEPTHLDNHMLSAHDTGGIFDIVREITRELARKHGLIYTYDTTPTGLAYFREEFCSSQVAEAVTWEKLASWTEPGIYHLITHSAVDSPELDGMCSETHPARPWAGEYRVRDYAFLTSPATRVLIEKLGFELIDVERLRRLNS